MPTLKELNAQPGDVVALVGTTGEHHYKVLDNKSLFSYYSGMIWDYECKWDVVTGFTLVSRANPEPKLWKDMTPEEKGALLLAHHEGKGIECFCKMHKVWAYAITPHWASETAYRIKSEPKRETVEMRGGSTDSEWCFGTISYDWDSHKITFDIVDGKPDCSTIKMEEI